MTQTSSTQIPANLADTLLDKAAGMAISPNGVDVPLANRTVSIELQTVAKAALPDTDAAKQFAGSTVKTLAEDTRKLAALAAKHQFDLASAPSLPGGKVLRRPGEPDLSQGTGPRSVADVLATGQIFYASQNASASQGGQASSPKPAASFYDRSVAQFGWTEPANQGPVSPFDRLALKTRLYIPAQPLVSPDIEGIQVKRPPVRIKPGLMPSPSPSPVWIS